ncbi:ABC transporter permease [Pseudomonas sp. YeP6b]|uniref:ABC transporter permease n=1 Tax=Pseudomonas sp. YeP6b TaxID=2861775 RepID=UPI0021D99B91|nr:ABC transporter permease [Pseudomonas sp. YeP6b]UXZ20687.1 ABC transporter permease [Pseudomonas sp. YeP6b]
MKYLAEFLTKNPFIVVLMFCLTLIGVIVGLLVSWEVLYRDYLSKTLTIPSWLVLLIFVIVFFGWIFYGTRKKQQADGPLELIADRQYGVERVNACGKKFLSCKFDGTEIVIDAQSGLGFENCNFSNQRFTFDGAAARTLAILTFMYKDPSFRPLVDATIANIKSGDLPVSKAPFSGGTRR